MRSAPRGVVIADTNVVSFLLRRGPEAGAYTQLLSGYDVRVSFMTAAELKFGAEKHRWSQRRRVQLQVLLHKYPVVPFSDDMVSLFARIVAAREHAGRPMETADAWIATTAIYLGVPLATHDANFAGTPGLRIISAMPMRHPAQPWPGGRDVPHPTQLDAHCRCSF